MSLAKALQKVPGVKLDLKVSLVVVMVKELQPIKQKKKKDAEKQQETEEWFCDLSGHRTCCTTTIWKKKTVGKNEQLFK